MLENSEREGDSTRKCSIQFSIVRGCTSSLFYIVGKSYYTVHPSFNSVQIALENSERRDDSMNSLSPHTLTLSHTQLNILSIKIKKKCIQLL